MTDSELLLWIAGHLTEFYRGAINSDLKYIDDDGNTHIVHFCSDEPNPTDLSILKGCIAVAIKEMEKK